MKQMIDDEREIRSISQDQYTTKVGENGVTKIVLYMENGQMGLVPWVAIYKGGFLSERMDVAGSSIRYKEI